MGIQNKLEEHLTLVRLAAFILAIVPTSITVSFAAFLGNEYMMAMALLPCVITLAFTIIPTPLPALFILICGITSFLISTGIIIYTALVHADKLKTYLPLPI